MARNFIPNIRAGKIPSMTPSLRLLALPVCSEIAQETHKKRKK
jgi:hypothetical protein